MDIGHNPDRILVRATRQVNLAMYIVAIGWLYVVVVMAATESNLTAAAMTLLWYGVLPLALFLWLFGTPQRRRSRRSGVAADQKADQDDRTDADRNE